MKKWIANYVKGCAICQQNKILTHQTKVPTYRIPTEPNAHPFQRMAMDLITGLPPIWGKDAILSPKEKEEQHKFLSQNLCLQRIRCSKSPYTSGFFLIWKKDGKFYPVQDYWNLNKWTIPNKYPLPLILELIYDLAEKCLFSKFDIWWGYNNICIKEGNEYKATFKTSEGLFEPTVMFFGLTNSPTTFQTMMDDIFQDEVTQGWLHIYMDNMIIATEDNEVLYELCVNHILDKLEKFNLFLKPEKCKFHQCEVEYLGVLIGNGTIKIVKVQGLKGAMCTSCTNRSSACTSG